MKQFIEIAFFRSKPQDLPATANTLWSAVAVALFTYVIASLPDSGPGLSAQRAILDLVVTALFLYGCLVFLKRTERFQQAFSALAGSGAVINLVAAPLIYSAGGADTLPASAELILLLLFGWGVALSAYIFRDTFELSLASSTMIAFAYVMTAIQLSQMIFTPMAG